MYIEEPVFVVSKDNTTVGCYRTVDRAERTLTRKIGGGLQLESVLVFDGRSRSMAWPALSGDRRRSRSGGAVAVGDLVSTAQALGGVLAGQLDKRRAR